MLNNTNKKSLVLALGVSVASGTVLADEAKQAAKAENSMALQEVVVTAQKREQNMQDTPIAITAYDRQAIEDQNIHDISDVGFTTPNIQIAESPGGSTGATIAMRGSVTVNPAVTWEPTVGLYMDGVFIGKNVGGLFDVAELERVEVLRGPQGTLYGKNTVGGAINLVTRKPGESFGGNVKVGAGNFGMVETAASVDTGKFANVASFNVSVNKRDRDGFYENTSTNPDAADEFKKLDSLAAKISGLFDITDNLNIYYTFDSALKDNTPSFGQTDAAGAKLERKDKGALNGSIYDRSRVDGHAVTVTYALNDNLTLKSITAYREMEFDDRNDFDGSDFTGFHAQRHVDQDQTSQEFQVIGTSDIATYVAGLFYFNENAEAYNPLTFFVPAIPATLTANNTYGVEATSYAAFGQVDWLLTDQLTFTTGLRFTQEKKDAFVDHPVTAGGFGEVKADDSWSNVSPMAALSYAWTDFVSTYAKISQGWKAGGFNGEPNSAALAKKSYDAEKVTAVELGLKSRWFDERLQTNVAIFQNKIKDMQLSEFLGLYSDIHNAGEATVNGFELEGLFAITSGLTATLNYGLLDAEYDDFEIAGVQTKDTSKFPYMPTHKYSLGLEYTTDLSFAQLRARLDWSHRSNQFAYHDVTAARLTEVEAYDLLNGRVGLIEIGLGGTQTLEVGVWGENLTDEEYRINGIPFATAPSPYAVNYYGDPRTFGIDATYNF